MMLRIFGDYHELGILAEVKGVVAIILAWVLEAVDYPNSAIPALFYLMLADLILGFARAWKSGSISGRRITRGAFKFFRYWLAVALFVWVDDAIFKAISVMPIRLHDAFIAYLSINEAFSCWEHLAFFGMPMPEAFRKRLHNYRETIAAAPGDWSGEDRRERRGEGRE